MPPLRQAGGGQSGCPCCSRGLLAAAGFQSAVGDTAGLREQAAGRGVVVAGPCGLCVGNPGLKEVAEISSWRQRRDSQELVVVFY